MQIHLHHHIEGIRPPNVGDTFNVEIAFGLGLGTKTLFGIFTVLFTL